MLKRFSIQGRFLLLLVPLAIMVCVVSYQVKTQVNVGIDDLVLGQQILNLANASQIAVADMGSGMKGYMLNPADQTQLQLKKDADENNVKALSDLRSLAEKSLDPTVKKLGVMIEELEKLDEERLNAAENEIVGVIQEKKFDEARRIYEAKYVPARKDYDTLSHDLAAAAKAKSAETETAVRKQLQTATTTIIITLILGTLLFSVILVSSIRGLTKELNGALVSFLGISGSLNGAAEKVADQSADLLSSSTQISASLTETTATTTELEQTVLTTSSAATVCNEKSAFCREKANEGRRAIETALNSMREIRDSNVAIRGAMNANDQRFEEIISLIHQITEKTKVINEIVFQTKLLSFNASVEAARAGEHGKGFSVVAEEIGNLATLSGTSASEIAQMLNSSAQRVKVLVDSTKEEVQTILSTADSRVERGMQTSESCDEVFKAIDAAISDLAQRTSEIAIATKEQSTGVAELSKAIGQISDGTNPVTSVAAAASEQSQSLKTEAESLVKLVDGLRTYIDGQAAA